MPMPMPMPMTVGQLAKRSALAFFGQAVSAR